MLAAKEETQRSHAWRHEAILSWDDFSRLRSVIVEQCGIRMPDSKRIMLEARLRKRLRALGITSFSEYCAYLFGPEGQEQEWVRMIDAVTTNKTDFFREPSHFDYLCETVVPELLARGDGAARAGVRLWSAGCSSGEEPYTIAMVLSDLAQRLPGFRFSILATDISTQVLEKAVRGVYPDDKIAPVPAPFRRKYLLRHKDPEKTLVRVVPELRALVSFRRCNFMESDFGLPGPVDVIFCRNVIIYFDRKTQERVLNRLAEHLAPDGYLFTGHSETLSGLDVPLAAVAPTVYRKRP